MNRMLAVLFAVFMISACGADISNPSIDPTDETDVTQVKEPEVADEVDLIEPSTDISAEEDVQSDTAVTFECAVDSDCEDGNPCTWGGGKPNRCEDNQCIHLNKPNYHTACGEEGSYCSDGVCTQFDCDDGDPCTTDSLDGYGNCWHAPTGAVGCSDEPECVVDEDCADLAYCQCEDEEWLTCYDFDCSDDGQCEQHHFETVGCLSGCEDDACSANQDECAVDSDCPQNFCECFDEKYKQCHTYTCNDGDCHHEVAGVECLHGCENDTCNTAECEYSMQCEDDDPCTIDVCAAGKCSNALASDGYACGDYKVCQVGVCTQVECVNDEQCGTIPFGAECLEMQCYENSCIKKSKPNGTDCNAGAGSCQFGVCQTIDTGCQSASECPDTYDLPCYVPQCLNGICLMTPAENGLSCGVNEVCMDGECVLESSLCDVDADCEDGDPCTASWCNFGVCYINPDKCLDDFTCLAGECVHPMFTVNCDSDADCEFDPVCNTQWGGSYQFTGECLAEVGQCAMLYTVDYKLDGTDSCFPVKECQSSAECAMGGSCGKAGNCIWMDGKPDCNDNDPCTYDFWNDIEGHCGHTAYKYCEECITDNDCTSMGTLCDADNNSFVEYLQCNDGLCEYDISECQNCGDGECLDCTADSDCGLGEACNEDIGECEWNGSIQCKFLCPANKDQAAVWYGNGQSGFVNCNEEVWTLPAELQCSWGKSAPTFAYNLVGEGVYSDGQKAVLECSSKPTISPDPVWGDQGKMIVSFDLLECEY